MPVLVGLQGVSLTMRPRTVQELIEWADSYPAGTLLAITTAELAQWYAYNNRPPEVWSLPVRLRGRPCLVVDMPPKPSTKAVGDRFRLLRVEAPIPHPTNAERPPYTRSF